jgi:hypothetical protein
MGDMAYTYKPRIGDATTTVTKDKVEFQLTTNVKEDGQNQKDVVLIQDLTLEQQWFKSDKLILKFNEHRVEAGYTNANGDFVDNQSAPGDKSPTSLLARIGAADKCTYNVSSKLYRSTALKRTDIERLFDKGTPDYRQGVISSTVTMEAGAGAAAGVIGTSEATAVEKLLKNKPGDYKPNPPLAYDLKQTEEAAVFEWDLEAHYEAADSDKAPKVVKGKWNIKYTKPADGPKDTKNF